MLARTSRLRHPLGTSIPTPLLIPSFSSKGLGMVTRKRSDGSEVLVSEASDILEAASEFLTESMLISAYDVFYEHVPAPTSTLTEITVVDSGGYETSEMQDLSATFVHSSGAEEWDDSRYREVLNSTWEPIKFPTPSVARNSL